MLDINDINVLRHNIFVEDLYIAKMHFNSDRVPMFVCLTASTKLFFFNKEKPINMSIDCLYNAMITEQ